MEETKQPMTTEDNEALPLTEPLAEGAADAPAGDAVEEYGASEAPPSEDAPEAPPAEDASDTPPGEGDASHQEAPAMAPPSEAPSPSERRGVPAFCPDFLKALLSLAAVLLLLYGLHSAWRAYRLDAFRAQVQEALLEPAGIDKLPHISDWRVREVAVQTFQVSRGDGAYVVYVWRLPDGAYMVDTIRRIP